MYEYSVAYTPYSISTTAESDVCVCIRGRRALLLETTPESSDKDCNGIVPRGSGSCLKLDPALAWGSPKGRARCPSAHITMCMWLYVGALLLGEQRTTVAYILLPTTLLTCFLSMLMWKARLSNDCGLLDRYSGKLLHIDFGDCFEASMNREKFPEKVPFRLTRMMERAMEVSGIEGNFRYILKK